MRIINVLRCKPLQSEPIEDAQEWRSMKNKIITTITYLVAAVLLIVGPKTIFKVCEVGEKPMLCHWSTRAEIGIASILIVTAILYFLTKTIREKIFIAIVAIVGGIVAILIPSILIGGCGMKTMACQSATFPAFYVISAVLIIFSIIDILYLIKSKK